MAKLASDLFSATSLSSPASLDDLMTSGTVPPDFEIDSVDSHQEDSSGPYQPGEVIQTSIAFGGQEDGHSANLAAYDGNHTFNGSSGGEVTPQSTQDILPSIEWDVDSNASDGSYTIGVVYDENFNSGATDMGVEKTLTVTVKGFSISFGVGPLSSTEMTLDLTIESGDPDYDVLIERSDANDGTYEDTVVNTTETSTGTYSYTDSGLNSGTTYYYKATVTDNSGSGETLTDTDSGTTL